MKTSAIIRIVLYSLIIFLLSGILLTALGIGTFMFNVDSGSSYNQGEGSVPAADVSSLSIDWAAGSVTIQTAETDQITFTESGNFDDEYAMAYKVKNGTLSLSYAKPKVAIGLVSTPSKDLVITVPENWNCQELELNGAALDVEVHGVSVRELSIDGAAFEVLFNGTLDQLSCDGAACQLQINCINRPQEIDLDGAACSLDLTIPDGCGFLVQVDGLSCDFDTDVNYQKNDDAYSYADQYCQIDVNGISCEITINYTPQFN